MSGRQRLSHGLRIVYLRGAQRIQQHAPHLVVPADRVPIGAGGGFGLLDPDTRQIGSEAFGGAHAMARHAPAISAILAVALRAPSASSARLAAMISART